MTPIQAQLRMDHADLLVLFDDLKNAVEGADDPTIQSVWSEFERRLFAHLDAEERYLLPALEKKHADPVARAKVEHARIRALVSDLGIRADLHILRKSVADALVDMLKSHAAWENETLYLIADRELPAEHRTALHKAVALVRSGMDSG